MAINIDQVLTNESGRISRDIYKRTINSSPWLKLVKKDKWPNGMGSEINVLTFDRSLPAGLPTWDTVGYNTGSGTSSCVPTAQVITPAQTQRSYNLAQTALESNPLCVNDIRFSFEFEQQLKAVYANLQQNVAYVWQDRHRDEYTRLAEHKVIAHSGLPESSASFPLIAPTSRLTQGILDKFRRHIVRESNEEDVMGIVNGQKQLALITSAETSDSLIRINSDIREDFRYAMAGKGEVSPLLKPMGVEFAYRGFYHVIDEFPARWEFTGGAWVRVRPFTKVATTNGTKDIVNDDYENATYEDSVIFMPNVMTSLVPDELTNPGGNIQFDPQMYMGTFRWRNIPDRIENPDGNIGFFRAVMQSGSKPELPEVGYVIRHLRCDAALNLITCS